MDPRSFDIPVPPSTNKIWKPWQNRLVLSPDYRRWIKEAGWEVAAQRKGAAPIHAPCKIDIAIGPMPPRRDADNVIKQVQDLMQAAGVVQNDNLIRGGTWGDDPSVGRGRILVTVRAS